MDPKTRALLNTIRYAEGTWRDGSEEGYRVMFGGGLAPPGSGRHPDRVIKGGGYASAAAGAYQFLPQTWSSAARAVGVKEDQFFDPAAQDRAAAYLVSRRLGGTQLGDTLTPEVASKLAPEWASFPTANGSSFYGQPVKKLGVLDSFYRRQLAALSGGNGGAPVASAVTPAAVSSSSGGDLGASEIDWAKVLMGPSQQEAQPLAEKRRFAMAGLASPGLLGGVSDGRMAGEAARGGGIDFSDPAQNPFLAAVGGTRKEAPAVTASSTGQAAPVKDADPFMAALTGALDTSPAPVAAPVKPAGSGQVIGELGIVDLGKRLQGLGVTVRENPHFGDGRVGKHSPNSHHYAGNALDLTFQEGDMKRLGLPDSQWLARTKQLGSQLKAAFPGAEIFYPGNDPVGGHHSHVHIASPGGRMKAAEAARKYGFV